MFRLSKPSFHSRKWLAVEFRDIPLEWENIEELSSQGTPVLIVGEISDAEKVLGKDVEIEVLEGE